MRTGGCSVGAGGGGNAIVEACMSDGGAVNDDDNNKDDATDGGGGGGGGDDGDDVEIISVTDDNVAAAAAATGNELLCWLTMIVHTIKHTFNLLFKYLTNDKLLEFIFCYMMGARTMRFYTGFYFFNFFFHSH